MCSSKILHRHLGEDKQDTGILHPKILVKTKPSFILLLKRKRQDRDAGKQEEIIKIKTRGIVKVLMLMDIASNAS